VISKFINRQAELNLLQEEFKKAPSFVVLYGRRRIGKSRLIEEFTSGKDSFYFVFPDASKQIQMREFKKQASAYFADPYIEKLETDSWFDLFDYISRLLGKGKIVVLDEFSYAVKTDPRILSDLQRAWDRSMSKSGMMLIISGSLLGLMREEVLSSGSPLYGRRTRDILLEELRPWHALDFFKDREYGIMAYMLVGGVPSYLQVSARHKSLRQLVEREFLDQNGYFYREPYFLLAEELREPRNYFSILAAIASGNSTANGIANYVGMETRKIFPYLEQLSLLGFIERRVPLMVREKRGRYFIRENALVSWFNLCYRKASQIELGVASYDDEEMNEILGRGFERLALHYIPVLSPFEVDALGSWWHRDVEIDAAAVNRRLKKVLFLEAKWKELGYNEALGIIEKLKQKSSNFAWNRGRREEYFGILARNLERKKELIEKGYLVFDLRDLIRLPLPSAMPIQRSSPK